MFPDKRVNSKPALKFYSLQRHFKVKSLEEYSTWQKDRVFPASRGTSCSPFSPLPSRPAREGFPNYRQLSTGLSVQFLSRPLVLHVAPKEAT